MGFFDFLKKSPQPAKPSIAPYREAPTNLLYNLLFCDDLDLFKNNTPPPYRYPYDLLFSPDSTAADLQKIIDDDASDPRIKALAYHRQMASGQKPTQKELLAVIVEVGLDRGLDVLAAFPNGTARYFNQTGKILIWEAPNPTSTELIRDLFQQSRQIVDQIGPWDKPRRPAPTRGNMRITFLVSDGLYFGEGAMDVLFQDPLAAPALSTATNLMKYLIEQDRERNG